MELLGAGLGVGSICGIFAVSLFVSLHSFSVEQSVKEPLRLWWGRVSQWTHVHAVVGCCCGRSVRGFILLARSVEFLLGVFMVQTRQYPVAEQLAWRRHIFVNSLDLTGQIQAVYEDNYGDARYIATVTTGGICSTHGGEIWYLCL